MRFVVGPAPLYKPPPSHDGKERDRYEERLCQQGMKHSNFVPNQNHPQSAEEPLQANPNDRAHAENPDPPPRLNSHRAIDKITVMGPMPEAIRRCVCS